MPPAATGEDFEGEFDPARPGRGAPGVAWHGEIGNIAALAAELGLPAAATPAEVVLAGWQRWSLALLPRLHGVFVLALREPAGLLLYRDPSGLRQLFVRRGPQGALRYASHLPSLLDVDGAPPLARPAVHEYLRFLDIAAPQAVYETVQAVEAGQALRASAQGLQPPSAPTPADEAAARSSFAAAVEALEGRLQASVQRALDAAQRPAAFLSGGIDSALLCALAARERPDLTAITVGFEGEAFDEAPGAQRVAAQLGLRHEVWRFSRAQYLAAFERFTAGAEQPMADPAMLATLLAFERCRERFDLVLDGTGADEALGLLPPRHVRWAVGIASRVPAGLRLRLATLARATPGLAGYAPLVDFEHPADTLIRWHGFTRGEIERLCGEPVSFADTHFYRVFGRFPRTAHFARSTALLDAMPADRLTQALRLSGLRVRFPFADPEVDRFIRQQPPAHRHAPGEPKRLLRALLARRVPRALWDGPKHGFDFPLQAFLAEDDFVLVRRHLVEGRALRAGGLDIERVQHYARRFIAGDSSLRFRIWALVVLAAWLASHRTATRP